MMCNSYLPLQSCINSSLSGLSHSWYWAGKECRQNEPDKWFCLPTFQRSKSADFGCAPASAAAVWWNLESPQHKLKDSEQCAPGKEKTSHHTAFVQSLLHDAAWQGCGAEGKIQRKQPIKAQSPSCDMAVYTVGLLVMCSEERDISRQKSGLSRIRWCHTDKGTFPLLTRLWKNLRGSER